MLFKLFSLFIILPVAYGAGAGTNADPCLATCTGSGDNESCTFSVSAGTQSYGGGRYCYKFAECDDPTMENPVIGMKRGVK